MESLQLEKEYHVHVYETGPDGKLNLYSLFNYMQDIASEHAIKLGFGRDDMLRNNRFWVLSRMYAEITGWPLWDETLNIRTWPNGVDGVFALRNYEVTSFNGHHIASGSSSWLILDIETKRVQRPDSILSQFYPDLHSEPSPVRYASKLAAADGSGKSSDTFPVRVSDLDINLHTNNVRYLKWVYDNYPLEFIMSHNPQSAEINYLAESVHDEEVFIRTCNEESHFYTHSIFRLKDNRELCRIRLGWKENMKD